MERRAQLWHLFSKKLFEKDSTRWAAYNPPLDMISIGKIPATRMGILESFIASCSQVRHRCQIASRQPIKQPNVLRDSLVRPVFQKENPAMKESSLHLCQPSVKTLSGSSTLHSSCSFS